MENLKPHKLILATLFLLIAPPFVLSLLVLAPEHFVAASCTLLILGLFGVAVHHWGMHDPFSPPYFVGLALSFFVLSGIWYFEFLPDSTGRMLPTSPLWLVTCVGFLGMWAALVFGNQVRLPSLIDLSQNTVSPLLLLLLCAIGLVLAILSHVVGQGSFVYSVLVLAGNCFLTLPLIAAFVRTRSDRVYRWIFILTVFYTMFLVLFVFGSERRSVLRVLLFGLMVWHFRIRPIRIRTAVLVLVLLVIPSVYLLKVEQAARALYDKPLWALTPSAMMEVHTMITDFHDGSFGVVRSFNVLASLENQSNVLANVPGDADYLMGESYWKLMVAWIPRELWPNKPVNIQNVVLDVSRTGYHAIAQDVTLFGEAYWNFSWGGVIGVPLIMTLLLCATYRSAMNPGQKTVPLLYILWAPFFLEHMRGAFHVINLYFLTNVVFVYTVLKLGGIFSPRRQDDEELDQRLQRDSPVAIRPPQKLFGRVTGHNAGTM